MKLKYLLPALQSTVAIFLLHQYQLWIVLTRRSDMPGPGPAAILLSLINFPIAALRGIWFRFFDVDWPHWIFVVLLALFWYWAGREIELRLKRRTRATIRLRLARIATDVLLTALSMWFISESNTDFRWFPWPYLVPSYAFLLFWILATPVLLGYDLCSIARIKWKEREVEV